MRSEFPLDETGDVLRNLQEHGVDFSKEHEVDFILAFDDTHMAERCAQVIRRLERYRVQLQQNQRTGSVDLIASRSMRLDYQEITDAERELADLARTYGGSPDGWGTLQG